MASEEQQQQKQQQWTIQIQAKSKIKSFNFNLKASKILPILNFLQISLLSIQVKSRPKPKSFKSKILRFLKKCKSQSSKKQVPKPNSPNKVKNEFIPAMQMSVPAGKNYCCFLVVSILVAIVGCLIRVKLSYSSLDDIVASYIRRVWDYAIAQVL